MLSLGDGLILGYIRKSVDILSHHSFMYLFNQQIAIECLHQHDRGHLIYDNSYKSNNNFVRSVEFVLIYERQFSSGLHSIMTIALFVCLVFACLFFGTGDTKSYAKNQCSCPNRTQSIYN